MEFYFKGDDGKQKRRQSKDFGDITNLQTDIKVEQKKWDSIFHNWEEPHKCTQQKRPFGCEVCEELKSKGYVTHKSGKVYGANIAIVGDVHANIAAVRKLIKDNPDLTHIICVGDLALYADPLLAKADKKAFDKCKKEILEGIELLDSGKFQKFDIPVFVVKGNHDDYNSMFSDEFYEANIYYLPQSKIIQLGNLNIAIMGGVYSSIRIEKDSSDFKGRENRFYTYKEITKLMSNVNVHPEPIDLFITHQGASDIFPKGMFQLDEGSVALKGLLDYIRPMYYVHGHHHRNYQNKITHPVDVGVSNVRGHTEIIGLGNFGKNSESYIKINTLTKKII